MTRNRESAMPASWRGPSPRFKVSALLGARDKVDIKALEQAARHHATRMTTWDDVATKDHGHRAGDLKRSGIMLPDDPPAWAVLMYGETAFRRALFDAALTLFEDGAVTLFVDEAGQARCCPGAAERTAWACLSERLWNDIALYEGPGSTRPRRAFARVITAALPKAVSLDAQAGIVRGFAREAFTSRGAVVDWTIHGEGDGNPNAFLMVPARLLDDDNWGDKDCRLRDRREISVMRKSWGRHVNLVLEREPCRA